MLSRLAGAGQERSCGVLLITHCFNKRIEKRTKDDLIAGKIEARGFPAGRVLVPGQRCRQIPVRLPTACLHRLRSVGASDDRKSSLPRGCGLGGRVNKSFEVENDCRFRICRVAGRGSTSTGGRFRSSLIRRNTWADNIWTPWSFPFQKSRK